MLHPLNEDLTQTFVDKFERLFLKCREIQGVGWLHGISVMNGHVRNRFGKRNPRVAFNCLLWEPEVRGPLSFETDSWGFRCSIVEMLTGVLPWFGKSIEEIYQSVVVKQEKPHIPSGLPPALESVISGCFEYDLRNRSLMEDILSVFQSFPGRLVLGDESNIFQADPAEVERVGFDTCPGVVKKYQIFTKLSKDKRSGWLPTPIANIL